MKRKVFIAIHQLNFGGAQKSLLSALDAINYNENEVTLYVRKNRLDLLSQVNKNISRLIINQDKTRYYRKPYSIWLTCLIAINNLFRRDTSKYEQRLKDYIVNRQFEFEKKNYFFENDSYDIAIAYMQSYTAKSVIRNIRATRKVMFYHGSTDTLHELHEELMREYDNIYCVSKGSAEAIIDCYPEHEKKIGYIDNYVDAHGIISKANVFVPEYPMDSLILCTCGRITTEKGYDLAVKVAEILISNNIKFKWYFIGDGSDRQRIDSMIAEKHLSDNIIITGLMDNPYPYMKYCDVYVQPSYEESYGLTIREAMILNTIVISTATVGGKSLINDKVDGLLADINATDLAGKIMYLIKNTDLQTKIKNNLAEKDYSKDYDRFCSDWRNLLEG